MVNPPFHKLGRTASTRLLSVSPVQLGYVIVWFTVAIFVVKLNCRSISYCGRAKAGCCVDVGAGVSVGNAISVGVTVAEGIRVSVGGTGAEVGDAHETMRKMQTNESPTLVVVYEGMELILLDLRLSLNLVSCHSPEGHTVLALGASVGTM